ncbi:MAG: hypothetical protein QOF89_4902 [Acidobacteriota bacterium]|jgi:uncharacterized membrane protein YphA (DoxX/SURF4 family)|nr:hypothetical protein [Acidobacteriota bacterium]
MRLVSLASRYFLAAVFLYAGIDKALHYGGFVNALRGYVLLPRAAAPYLALPIILCEIFVGVSLLVRPWRSRAAVLAAGLLAVFTLALAVNQHYAPRTLCGCWFTLTLGRSTPLHVLQNLVLLGLAISVWMDERIKGRISDAVVTGV